MIWNRTQEEPSRLGKNGTTASIEHRYRDCRASHGGMHNALGYSAQSPVSRARASEPGRQWPGDNAPVQGEEQALDNLWPENDRG